MRRAARRIPPTTAAVALLLAGLGGGCDGGSDLPRYWRVPDFSLVDQAGDTLRASDLRGRVWAASFVFTNCSGVCPSITAGMAGVRDSLDAEGLLGHPVRLVSISTDPARDTPRALEAYAARFGGSPPTRWAFLTGTPPERVHDLIREGFRLGVSVPDSAADPEAGGYQVGHSPRVLVVDRGGWIRGTYNARTAGAFDSVLVDLRALAR